MKRELSARKKWLLVIVPCACILLILFFSRVLLSGDLSGFSLLSSSSVVIQPNVVQQNANMVSKSLFSSRVPALSWIVGRDCQNGMRAYLQNVAANPDAALVGTGWLDPTTGKLINGQSNNCMPGSLSMDNVVQMVHQHGGRAYLTITMETDGSATSWTTDQQAAYVVKASRDPAYIAPILREMQRVGYDGVIMDLEGTDNTYPHIQQAFALYNQVVWHALQPLHKLYGIALLHKTSDSDAYYYLNGFENWHLLSQSADFLVIMAVDQSYWTPGPSVSVTWLQQLLQYARQTMPQMLSHVIWELPLYGDTWHQSGGQWAFDGTIDYQDAMTTIDQLGLSQIDQADSNMQDPYQPHIVYTDSSGVTHSLWFMTAQSLSNILSAFQKILRKIPQLAHAQLQFAVWWRTTAEPPGFWQKADALY